MSSGEWTKSQEFWAETFRTCIFAVAGVVATYLVLNKLDDIRKHEDEIRAQALKYEDELHAQKLALRSAVVGEFAKTSNAFHDASIIVLGCYSYANDKEWFVDLNRQYKDNHHRLRFYFPGIIKAAEVQERAEILRDLSEQFLRQHPKADASVGTFDRSDPVVCKTDKQWLAKVRRLLDLDNETLARALEELGLITKEEAASAAIPVMPRTVQLPELPDPNQAPEL